MSIGLLTLSEQDQREVSDFYSAGLMPQKTPGFFDGVIKSPFQGIEHGVATASAAAASAMTSSDASEMRQKTIDWMTNTRADAKTMGTLAQIGHGLGTIVAESVPGLLGGPVGAAASVGSLTAFDKYHEMLDATGDREVALKSAGISGLTMGLGAGLPGYLGKTLVKQAASGVGLNVGLGALERGGTSKVLSDAGYQEMANDYKILDGSAIAVDMVLGAAFPLGARLMSRGAAKEANIPTQVTDVAMLGSEGITQRTRDPVLQTTPEGVDARAAAEADITHQMVAEGRDLHEITFPSGVMDNVIPNPEFPKVMSLAARSIDEMMRGDGVDIRALTKEFETLGKAMEEEVIAPSPKPDVEGKPAETRPPVAVEREVTSSDLSKSAARQLVDQKPDMKVLNNDRMEVSARELLDQADRRFEQEHRETNLYKIAVACAIGVGE